MLKIFHFLHAIKVSCWFQSPYDLWGFISGDYPGITCSVPWNQAPSYFEILKFPSLHSGDFNSFKKQTQ